MMTVQQRVPKGIAERRENRTRQPIRTHSAQEGSTPKPKPQQPCDRVVNSCMVQDHECKERGQAAEGSNEGYLTSQPACSIESENQNQARVRADQPTNREGRARPRTAQQRCRGTSTRSECQRPVSGGPDITSGEGAVKPKMASKRRQCFLELCR